MNNTSTLWSFLRRGFIAYVAAKVILLPLFLFLGLEELRHRQTITSDSWDWLMIVLLISVPFWAAYTARGFLRNPKAERFRQELMGPELESTGQPGAPREPGPAFSVR